jgi:NAD(P)-dependent dehydrogenase (short-subunit alcohol dehydrogenase family)
VPAPHEALAGRTAVVTGGGRGLGRAIALRLAGDGLDVVLAGRDPEPLAETGAAIERAGGHALAVPCDVTDPASVDALHSRVDEWRGPATVLVNNAGIPGPTAALVDVEPAEWDEVMAVNVRGVYLCCRAFLPAMMERGDGDVINVASVSGKRPLALRTPYCASKMAVIGLTVTLAAEAGPAGVRVNSLSPGPVRGPRMDGVLERAALAAGTSVADAEREFVSRAALGRMVEEEEVADALAAMLRMRGMSAADVDLSAGMVA